MLAEEINTDYNLVKYLVGLMEAQEECRICKIFALTLNKLCLCRLNFKRLLTIWMLKRKGVGSTLSINFNIFNRSASENGKKQSHTDTR